MNKRRTKRATTYDIARRAGVDQSSVSKVLNGARNFRRETVERIHKACRELNFVPNASARALRSLRSRTLAVHVPFGSETVIADPFVSELLDAVRRQASRSDYDIILAHDGAPEDFAALVRSHRADGLMITTPRHGDPRLKQVERYDLPCVLGRYDGELGTRMAVVDIHNAEVGRRAAAFLRSRRCTRVGVIVEAEGLLPADDFLAGLREGGDGGIEFTVVRTDVSIAGVRRAAEGLLAAESPPQAMVANTCIGMLALRRAVEASSRSETLVLGCDSVLHRRMFGPGPHIALPIERLGRKMVQTLTHIIETGQAGEPELIPADIVDESGNIFEVKP